MNRFSRFAVIALYTLAPSSSSHRTKSPRRSTRVPSGSAPSLAIGAIGLGTTAWKYFFAKPDARQSLESNFLGFGVCLGAGTLIELFRRWMG
ncbi:hypothetical protein ACN28S_67640 [Cystobacter fuscus]